MIKLNYNNKIKHTHLIINEGSTHKGGVNSEPKSLKPDFIPPAQKISK